MQITLESKPFAGIETEALVSYVFEGTDPVQGRVSEMDQLTGGLLRKLAKSGELTGKALEFTLIHAPAGLKAVRLLLVGRGRGSNSIRRRCGRLAVRRCAIRSRGL